PGAGRGRRDRGRPVRPRRQGRRHRLALVRPDRRREPAGGPADTAGTGPYHRRPGADAMSAPDTSRIRSGAALGAARSAGRAALIGYLPVGYPDLPGSIDAARTLIDHGADMIELGLPYSDPVLDGPVIQRAAGASLAGGHR